MCRRIFGVVHPRRLPTTYVFPRNFSSDIFFPVLFHRCPLRCSIVSRRCPDIKYMVVCCNFFPCHKRYFGRGRRARNDVSVRTLFRAVRVCPTIFSSSFNVFFGDDENLKIFIVTPHKSNFRSTYFQNPSILL